jgi:Helicase associated domain
MTLRQDARAIREADAKSTNIVKKVKASTKKEAKKEPKTLSWDDRYRQLLEYKLRVGHANPQRSKVTGKADRELTMWLSEQRKQFREGRLPIERIQALCGAGSNGFDENADKNTKGKRVVSEPRSGTKRKAVLLATTPKTVAKKNRSKKVNAITPESEGEDSNARGDGSQNNSVQPKRRQSRTSRFGVGDYRLLSGRSLLHERGLPI